MFVFFLLADMDSVVGEAGPGPTQNFPTDIRDHSNTVGEISQGHFAFILIFLSFLNYLGQ